MTRMGCVVGLVWVWVLVVWMGRSGGIDSPVVRVSNGTVGGYYMDGAACFLGIPFMKPPLNNLRFTRPVPAENWSGVLNGTEFRPQCPQTSSDATNYTQSEDCLYLNVFTPNVSGKYPVMVFIHGGAYIWGSAYNYQPKGIVYNMVKRGIVVVSIQYRLNVFGFFTTMDDVVPANLALLDQIQALKWVQSEVGVFGGDRDKVTIFGESAGSTSVSILTYSPLAQGLFHQAIMESGTIYSPFALDGNMFHFFNSSKSTAIMAGCATQETWEHKNFNGLVECMRQKPWEDLHAVSEKAAVRLAICCPWSPVVDGPGGVLPDWPRNLVKSHTGRVPILVGTNQNENFYYYAAGFLSGSVTIENFTQASFDADVAFYADMWGDAATPISNLIKYNYYESVYPPIGVNDHFTWFQTSSEFISGRDFYAGTIKEVRDSLNPTSGNPVYLYSFDYISDAYPWPQSKTQNRSINGSFHGYELYFLFNMTQTFQLLWGLPIWDFSPQDLQVVDQMGILWTNFAKTGDPNKPQAFQGAWKPVNNASTLSYYSIDTVSETKVHYQREADQLWNYLIPAVVPNPGPTFPPNPTSPPPLPTLQALTPNEKKLFVALWVCLGIAVSALILLAVCFVCVFLRLRKAKRSVKIEPHQVPLSEFLRQN